MLTQIEQALPDFVEIPSVAFLMGTPERELRALAQAYGGTRESYREESPQHVVCLPAFALGRVPVTHALYALFVAATGARAPVTWHGMQPPPVLRDHPVVDVSWEEAQGFCGWLRGLTGVPYRLPSEAEWEHAARGTDGRRFPWGAVWDATLANTREGGRGMTVPVGQCVDTTAYGCLDMAGNVWEWTVSLDARYPYDAVDGREDVQAAGRRILRGGCYANPHGFARCACRFRLLPTVHNEFLGFRLAR